MKQFQIIERKFHFIKLITNCYSSTPHFTRTFSLFACGLTRFTSIKNRARNSNFEKNEKFLKI
jgi:hypothetical protein